MQRRKKETLDLFYGERPPERISKLGYLNWKQKQIRGCESILALSVAFPYSRDRGVNSAYLSVRCAVVPFFTPGNDPFVRRVSATLSENVHSTNDNDGLRPEYIAPIARGR